MPDGMDTHRGLSGLVFRHEGEREIDIGYDGNLLDI